MESNIVASRPKPSSASNQTTERAVENRMTYDEIIAAASNPKVFFLELEKNVQAVENNYDLTMKQWEEMKSRSQMETYDKSENGLSRSTSSYNSIKNVSSDNFAPKITECEADEKPADDSQLQVVLTPRTPREEEEEDEESPPKPVVPVRVKNSLSSVKTTSKKPRKVKSKKKSQLARTNDEQLRTSLLYSAKAKRKKLHGRLKNSNSKSTIATRDTNYSDKKVDRKKFKRQQSLDTMSAFQAPQSRKRANALKARESRQLNSKTDFIEIFHSGKVAKNGGGSVSSQLSKGVARTVAEAKKRKRQPPPSVVEKNNNADVDPQIQVQDPFLSHLEREDKSNEQQQQQHCQTSEQPAPPKACSSEVYDPFYPRNYELPTLASKMKRNHKPYYHHFNIRNIPFVVGTSLSPSHNLGLNIQQVLSIIKVKQPAVPGISPLLIRKVSRGVRPVSTLFEHINSQYAGTYRNLGRRRSSRGRLQRIGSFSCEQLMQRASCSLGSANFNKQSVVCEPLYEEDEDNQSTCSEARARNTQQQEAYRSRKQHHHCQHSAENGCKYGAQQPTNNKEITEVFTRLYDQFDKMVSQHERLKEQLEKRKDKALLKEVSELESAMTSKEREITAVVNLYNEVASLKKQMKLLHERNSFVCIATPDPSFQALPSKSRAKTAPVPYLDVRPSRREMPNALKLVGLLRQMQAFQRQLALA